jgi:hypothetical protein
MCTTIEVSETIDVPPGLQGVAWVRPGPAPSFNDQTDCAAWSRALASGTVVTSSGVFRRGSSQEIFCTVERAVACCAPVP